MCLVNPIAITAIDDLSRQVAGDAFGKALDTLGIPKKQSNLKQPGFTLVWH